MKLKMSRYHVIMMQFMPPPTIPKWLRLAKLALITITTTRRAPPEAESLRVQIAVARDLNVPIIIHARDADDDMADILEDEYQKGAYKGVLHCFSSGERLAKRALAIGFYISFSGIVTFKSATEIQQVAQFVPSDRILVETDAPFLAPVPMRGKRTNLLSQAIQPNSWLICVASA